MDNVVPMPGIRAKIKMGEEVNLRLRNVPLELTPKQYQVLLDLYHECHDVWLSMPRRYHDAFDRKLRGY